jgi:hypothetical protein
MHPKNVYFFHSFQLECVLEFSKYTKNKKLVRKHLRMKNSSAENGIFTVLSNLGRPTCCPSVARTRSLYIDPLSVKDYLSITTYRSFYHGIRAG